MEHIVLRSDDPICSVPPRWLGFCHVGRILRLEPRWNTGGRS